MIRLAWIENCELRWSRLQLQRANEAFDRLHAMDASRHAQLQALLSISAPVR